jgi:hypothetical protein
MCLFYQRHMLSALQKAKTHVIISADKNLGPCIIKRSTYIQRALNDHLLDNTTYKQLSSRAAHQFMEQTTNKLTTFIDQYKKLLDPADIKYLLRTTTTTDPYPKFYITAKVHKTPWSTRPIVSVSGSLLEGLGKYVDKILQPFSQSTIASIQSSTALKDYLMTINQP